MKKTNQQGFALLVSMILLIVLTLIGFSVANRGKLSAQVASTTSRYEAVSAAAEAEISRLTNLIASSPMVIEVGNGVLCDTGTCLVGESPTVITQVWSNRLLGGQQVPPNIMPDFSDFSDTTFWNLGIQGQTNSQYDTGSQRFISTRAFVQELVRREVTSGSGNVEIDVEYLITVKAFLQNPGDTANEERETIVLQSSYSMHFLL